MNVCAVCCADELHSKGCVSVHGLYDICIMCVTMVCSCVVCMSGVCVCACQLHPRRAVLEETTVPSHPGDSTA